jgi:ABC-type transporter Mla subunit MlaD
MTDDMSKRETAPGTPEATAGKVRDDGRKAAKTVKRDIEAAADVLREDAGEAMDAATEQMASMAHEAKDALNQRKDGLADSLDGVAGAMRKAAEQLDEDNGPGADMTRRIADRLGRASATLKNKDVGELVEAAEDFGRRQPAAFLGVSMLLGFAASRFVVASGHRRAPNGQQTHGDLQ